MSQRVFSLIVGVVFLLISLGHLLRVFLGATLSVQAWRFPCGRACWR